MVLAVIRKALARTLTIGLFFSAIRTARAVEPPGETHTLPCRPTIACTADIVPPGAFELEAGALYRRIDEAGRQWTFPFLAKQTLASWGQLQVGSNGFSVAKGEVPAQYLDDVTVGLKLHLVDQTARVPSIALSATASIPTFQGTGYLRTYDALFTAYATKDIGPLHLDLNAGASAWRIEKSPRPQEWIALAASTSLPPPFGVMVEGYYFTDAAPVALRDGGFLFAVSHSPKPWLMFDFGGDLGFFPTTRSYSLFFGMSVVPFFL
jgi:hypothetical protein